MKVVLGETNIKLHTSPTTANAERIYKETDKFTMFMHLGALFGGIKHACSMYTDPGDVIVQQKKNTRMGNRTISTALNIKLSIAKDFRNPQLCSK